MKIDQADWFQPDNLLYRFHPRYPALPGRQSIDNGRHSDLES
jgi:hypothetical protein